ncbi:MAG: YggS family pyridoxal phosphate-dependent enzyme [Oscillospiraceae bacterium]
MTENQLADNIARIKDNIEQAAVLCGRNPKEISLMAVTKTVAPEWVNAAIANGVTLLGENKAQELCSKYDSYNRDNVDIHFIGHLQTNKVKQIAEKVSTIQSVDSIKLAKEISTQAIALGKVMKVLVEVNIAGEQSKSGVSPDRLTDFLYELSQVPSIAVEGLMTIPPADVSLLETENFFNNIYSQFLDIQRQKIDNVNMYTLSMGMSNDYKEAIKHGSTMVRIGTMLFGGRDYL